MLGSFWQQKSLVYQLLVREIQSRYRGSIMGLLWSFVTPLLMLFIYTLVFKYVFKARWSVAGSDGEVLNFAMVLFLGLTIHGMIADILNRSPGLMLAHVNFVKKVVFPLDMLSWVVLFSALFNFVIGFILLLGFVFIELQAIPVTALLAPIILLPYFVMLLGISWILAAVGVFVRDVQQMTGTLSTLLLFVSPVFYATEQLPDQLQGVILLNPIAVIVEAFRSAVIYGQMPDFRVLGFYSLVAVLVAVAGHRLFQWSRRGFADVL